MSREIHGNILLGDVFHEARIKYQQHILNIEVLGTPVQSLPWVIPGFVDLHVHGGGGADIMEAGVAVATIAQTHANFGTTGFLATTMTAPYEELEKSFLAMKPFYQQGIPKGARLLGVHLEGPFISPQKLGAQPDFVREATLEEIRRLHTLVPIRVITLAPEMFQHLDLIRDLVAMNITVQIGHTNGTYEEGVKALEMGAKSFTHLFNAMSGLHHRAPGMVGAALAHAEHAEIIPDLLHVHKGAIKAALRAIPKIYFVTDATAATGMPDGDYKLGSHTVHKCLGGVQLPDGTLAGSALTMDQALRNLVSMGLSLEEASIRLSKIPAELLGLSDRGAFREGAFADFVVLNRDLTIADVIIEGDIL